MQIALRVRDDDAGGLESAPDRAGGGVIHAGDTTAADADERLLRLDRRGEQAEEGERGNGFHPGFILCDRVASEPSGIAWVPY
jgi:hypothetical protein